jgi:hypothetical protein
LLASRIVILPLGAIRGIHTLKRESGFAGDNESPYRGVNVGPTRGTSRRVTLIPDRPGVGSKFAFRSARGARFQMAMADGAVVWVAYGADPLLHDPRGSRRDRE